MPLEKTEQALVFNSIPQTYVQSYTESVCAGPFEQQGFGEEGKK